jgi:hypothetical protein
VRRIFAAAALLAWSEMPARTQGQPLAQPALGAGGTLCSQYTRAARSSDILYHQASNWLLGYVSGISEAMRTPGHASPLDGVSGDQVLRAATEYCEIHPSVTIAGAANVWLAAAPRPAPSPQQSETKKDDGDWIKLRLVAPDRKPLLDRR